MHHLIQRWRDQAGQADNINILLARSLKDFRGRDHDAQINDLVIIAGKHDTDNILADIMDIALHRRHQHFAGAFALARAAIGKLFRLHIGQEQGNGLFHHTGGFHHLRQEHLAGAEKIADNIHSGH